MVRVESSKVKNQSGEGGVEVFDFHSSSAEMINDQAARSPAA